MKPVIVTLEPMADGSEGTTTVATFEEAFGEHSYAWGKKKKSADGKTPPTGDGKTPPTSTTPEKKEKTGYFSKKRIDERRTDRKDTRTKRKAERKAKWGARPLDAILKNGLKKFKDKLPKLRKTKGTDGKDKFTKENPDGTTTDVPKDQVTIVPPPTAGGQESYFDKKDLNTPNEVVKTVLPNGEVELSKLYNQEETETIPNEQGVDTVYKKEDVVDSGDASTSPSEGMSKGLKIGLIVGGSVLVVGIIAFVVYKSRQSK
jgi:hypothetical protein